MNRITSFSPLLNRILVKKINIKPKQAGGLILSSKASNDNQRFATVMSVGPGVLDKNGNNIPVQVKVGETVLLPDYTGTKVDMQDTDKDADYQIFKDTELVAVVEGFKTL